MTKETDLELCKAFAELESVTVTGILGNSIMAIGFSQGYNPITDLALNCAARDKYKVEIDYPCEYVTIYYPTCIEVGFGLSVEPNRAVIECILKSKRLIK